MRDDLADEQLLTGRKPVSRPFTDADRATIAALARTGLSSNEIAKRVGRGVPQVTRVVRSFGLAEPSSIALTLSLKRRSFEMLEAAARRRNTEPARLLVEIVEGVLKRGSVDRAIAASVEGDERDTNSGRVESQPG